MYAGLLKAFYGGSKYSEALDESKINKYGRERILFLKELGYSRQETFEMLDNETFRNFIDVLARYNDIQEKKAIMINRQLRKERK